MPDLPTGTVTFLFTDIEGSTRLWELHLEAMNEALTRHDTLLRRCIQDSRGHIFKTVGDAFCAVFTLPQHALAAALAAQKALQTEHWPAEIGVLKVRMALHTGNAHERENDFFGPQVNRVARLLAIGHGGQTLISETTHSQLRESLSDGSSLLDLGRHLLKDLQQPEHVWQLCHPDLPATFPPLTSLNILPHNLPIQRTSFIGREKESADIVALLSGTRLLTLTGTGGMGKTRLSLHTATALVDTMRDGIWLVELAPLQDAALVPQAAASVLGIKERQGQQYTESLIEALKPKQLLLLLDNCEHVLEAVAALADALLNHCPDIKILATSREGLRIPGEQIYRVPSLTLPPASAQPEQAALESLYAFEALRLFADRAALITDFRLTPSNALPIARLCRHLDGIPLALELAAARVRMMSVEQIEARLQDRFHLLTQGSRIALPRQQTLRALIDWSYDLLNAQEQSLFARLSVFSGGWTLQAAEQVCAGWGIENREVLERLTSLADKSLVVDDAAESGRYHLLETMAQYARDRLREKGEEPFICRQHVAFFLSLSEEANAGVLGADQVRWLNVLECEHDNLRSALAWCLHGNKEDAAAKANAAVSGLRLVTALHRYWEIRSHWSEGRQFLNAMLALPEAQQISSVRANALNGLGILSRLQGDYPQARAAYEKSLAIRRQIGDRRGIAGSLNNLGNIAYYLADYDAAHSLFEEALHLNRELGNLAWEGINLGNLGNIAMELKQNDRAFSLYSENLVICRKLNNRRAEAFALHNVGRAAKRLGDLAAARGNYMQSLRIKQELGDTYSIALSFSVFGSLALSEGRLERAAQLYAAEAAALQRIQATMPPRETEEFAQTRLRLQEAMGTEAYETAWARGSAMTLEQAASYALAVPEESDAP